MVKNIGVAVTSPRKACEDEFCPFHGTLPVRGKLLAGTVSSANAPKMVVVSREYPRGVGKYKRARLSAIMPRGQRGRRSKNCRMQATCQDCFVCGDRGE
jgi:hypothetical protein